MCVSRLGGIHKQVCITLNVKFMFFLFWEGGGWHVTYDLTEYWYRMFVGAIKLVRGAKHGAIVTTAFQFALQDNGRLA